MGQGCLSKEEPTGDFVEAVVLENGDDLKAEEIKEVSVGDKSCLLVKTKSGEIKAFSSKCTHYGAPLAKGSYNPETETIRCQWHGACFSLKNGGDIEDFPGLDSLHEYQVVKDGDNNQVKVRVRKELLGSIRRTKSFTKRDPDNQESLVIIGSGGSAQAAMENLRSRKYTGEITVITQEDALPYDRPKLSKAMTSSPQDLALRDKKFYEERDIKVLFNSTVNSLDTENKSVTYGENNKLNYDKLIIATGGTPRKLNISGSTLENIFTLRSPNDANKIAKFKESKNNIVVIGSSFIGMEVAAFFSSGTTEATVTVVSSSSVPFEASLGPEIGKFVMKMHQDKGVKFETKVRPSEFIGENGKVTKVRLDNGTELEADCVVLGVGVTPSTAFLSDTSVELDSRGYVIVNEHMETNIDGIYAVGDIAKFPLKIKDSESVAIGHWQLALAHGQLVAKVITATNSDKPKIDTVPFFWTVQFGKSIRYSGYGAYDEIVYDGDVQEGKFAAFYVKGDDVVSVASLMRDPVVADFANYLKNGNTLKKSDIQTWLKK